MQSVHNQVTIITGASRGIGRASARIFAAAGARVVLVARPSSDLTALHTELRAAGAQVLMLPTDVSDRAATARLVERVIDEWQRIDIVINNAGVGIQSNIGELPPDLLQRVLAVNLMGPLLLTQAALPEMRRQRSGMIVNVSSPVAELALPGIGGYAMSKAALDALSDTLRREEYRNGIRVATVYPGRIDTNFDRARIRVGGSQRVGRSPISGSAEQVAQAILRGVERRRSVIYALHPVERLLWTLHGWLPRAFDPIFGLRMSRRKPR
ncbi:MAG: SDR family oxidoreductase [Chloroflexi bacterium]|nr:SDR family oxidoreductase [Chloroflexota bacterium]